MNHPRAMKAFTKTSLLVAMLAMPVVVMAQTPAPSDPDAPTPSAAVTPNQAPATPAVPTTPAATPTTPATPDGDLTAHKTKDGILFQCIAPAANTTVYLAGDFNNWADNVGGQVADAKYKMDGPTASGIYSKTVQLEPGVHKFKYIVNTTWTAADWVKEKDADDNGVIYISGAGDVLLKNPVSPDWKPVSKDGKTTFQVYYPMAKSVYVAGDFNTWGSNKDGVVSDASCAMKGPDANGVWQVTLPVGAGTHGYKFAIDGNAWEIDPNADKQDSGGNSVLEVAK